MPIITTLLLESNIQIKGMYARQQNKQDVILLLFLDGWTHNSKHGKSLTDQIRTYCSNTGT
jgi:hypothetical protein